jgi:hypothetical protein
MLNDNFWAGFQKQSAMLKGIRSDKSVGTKPRTMIASKGKVNPNPLPSADQQATVAQNLKPKIKLESIPKIKKLTSGTHI